MNVADISPAAIGHAIAVLAESQPGHPVLTAIRLALGIAADRHNTDPVMDDYLGGYYHRASDLTGIHQVQEARYGAHGDRDRWIAEGSGPGPAPDWQVAA